MTQDQIDAVLSRVRTWPAERQQELIEIEAEYRGLSYEVSQDELRAIDEARASGVAMPEEVQATFARLRRA